jgi:hypothetical protein
MPESSPHPFEFFAASVAAGVAFAFMKAVLLDYLRRDTLLPNAPDEFTSSALFSDSQKDSRDDVAIVWVHGVSPDDYPDRCPVDRGLLAPSKFRRTDQQMADTARFAFRHPGQAQREPGSQRIMSFNPLRSRIGLAPVQPELVSSSAAWLAPPLRLASPIIQTNRV